MFKKNLQLDLKNNQKPSPIELNAPIIDGSEGSAADGAEQATGISADFLASIRQVDGCNSIRLNITADSVKAIFRTYPAGANL